MLKSLAFACPLIVLLASAKLLSTDVVVSTESTAPSQLHSTSSVSVPHATDLSQHPTSIESSPSESKLPRQRTSSRTQLRLLFLGDHGHHRPADRFAQLAPRLSRKGIELQYTDNVDHLTLETLNRFDGLVLYANIDHIEQQQADALLQFVASGHAFIPLHCATYCFRNDARMVALMGAQFLKHGGEEFSTLITVPQHPIMQGFDGFESWDETYVHHLHNTENRTVLEVRQQGMQAEGNEVEPWTWIRTHGAGRVFYTAWGHDERTWSHPGFQNLIERGIRWACGDDPALAGPYINRKQFVAPSMTTLPDDSNPFEYVEVGAKIPNYVPSNRWGTQAEPLTTMQKPLPAEKSIQRYVTPQGFHLEIFAKENSTDGDDAPTYAGLAGKPIAMNWDERGRLWVCETIDYPNDLQPQNKGRDRIRICEDTDQNGQADRFTVFAEDLSIPTAITFHRDAVIVQNGTETLWLKDTDGDDVADRREVIISNWNLGDTHGGVSQFRYGVDNWFWAMQGYNHSSPIITATGEQIPSFRMGFWRFRLDDSEPPVVTDLEFIRSTNNNTWGLGISEEGLIFGSTANHNPSVFMPIPNRYYEQVRGWGPEQLGTIAQTHLFAPISDRVRQVDHHGGYTAAAGHALYTARKYPQQWWNRTAFVCGPTGKLVGTFVLQPQGADFRATSPLNLVAADDEWAAPIAAEVGPDGNVWVLDWYNYIVQHNPTPRGFETGKGNAYESDLRDKKHGRFYRVVNDNNASPEFPTLNAEDSEQLLAALSDPTMLVRLHAQRLLIERNKQDIVPQLIQLATAGEIDEIGLNVSAIHALMTLSGLGYFETLNDPSMKTLQAALAHPSPGVRRVAATVIPQNTRSIELIQERLQFIETDAQVRLALLLKLAEQNASPLAGELVAEQFSDPNTMQDRWLADAVTAAAAKHVVPFLEQVVVDRETPLLPAQIQTLQIVAEHLSRGRPTSQELELILTQLTQSHPQIAAAVLDGLAQGWQPGEGVEPTAKMEQALAELLQQVPTTAKGRVIQLGSLLGSVEVEKHAAEIVQSMLETVQDQQLDLNERLKAARQLVEFRSQDASVARTLVDLMGPQASPEFASGVLGALSASTADGLAELLISRARSMTPTVRETALTVLLSRPPSTRAVLDAIEAGTLQIADLSLEHKRTLIEHPEQSIRKRSTQLVRDGGGLPNPDRQRVVEQLISVAQQTGDVELGKALFVKHCAKCHQHGDIGEKIGPNLTGMVVHPKEELLVHIMDPSRSVEGNFRLYTVVTTDGRIRSGMLAAETRTSIELVDTEAKRQTIVRADIEELLASPKSLMPEGFEKQMSPEDIKHLLEFLTDKGKWIPIDLRKVATVVSTVPMFYGQSPAERLVFSDWGPKTVHDVPFLLVDPQGEQVPNVVMLHGPQGTIPPRMPQRVEFPVNSPIKTIHLLGGVGGWSYPAIRDQSTSMIVRLSYADETIEDIELKNGVHIADYIRRVDVPESEFAFDLNGQQVRYLSLNPQRTEVAVTQIEFVKGPDATAPIVVAVTIERP